jgi:hypothetical protein
MRRGELKGVIIAALGFKGFRLDINRWLNQRGGPKTYPYKPKVPEQEILKDN